MTVFDDVQHLVTDRLAPGAAVAYLHDGVSEVQVLGEAQWLPTPAPLHSGMLYDLASLTKVVGTTTLWLQAADDGVVSPDQPLNAWLPAFTPATTFREALTHTSGLEGYIPHRDSLPATALKQALLTQLRPDPGERDQRVVYRDVNLLLVGWALEKIYGSPIQTLITERVLRPLGLPQATFAPQAAKCVPTSYDPVHGLRRGVVHDPKSAILKEHSGAAGLFASLADLMVFSEYAFGVRTSPVWPRHFATLNQDYTGHGLGRSLGWDLRRDSVGQLWLYHTGYTGTWWLLQPATKRALIVLTNRVHPVVNTNFLTRRDQIITTFLNGQP